MVEHGQARQPAGMPVVGLVAGGNDVSGLMPGTWHTPSTSVDGVSCVVVTTGVPTAIPPLKLVLVTV